MSEQLFGQILSQIADDAEEDVALSLMLQNEPLLDARLLDWLKIAHETPNVGFVSIVTNGSLLTKRFLDQFCSLDRAKLTVSINARDRADYKQLHRRDRWDAVVGTLEGWDGPRDRVRVSMVAGRGAGRDARAFVKRWRDSGYQVRLVPMLNRAGSLDDAESLVPMDDDFSFCHYPIDTLTVLNDGRVIMCCNDWTHESVMGNIEDTSIATLWQSPPFRKMRRAAIEGRLREKGSPCATCDYPIRSIVRSNLVNALEVGTASSTERRNVGEFKPHETTFIADSGGESTCVVLEVLPEKGAVILQARDKCFEGHGRLRLRIDDGELFEFGRLGTIWASGSLLALEPETANSASRFAWIVDDAPEAAYLKWYASDWRETEKNLTELISTKLT